MATNSADATLKRTQEQRDADIKALMAMPLKQLRKHQGLIEQQIGWAYKQRNDEALAALQIRADDLMIAVWRKTWPNG